MRRLIHGAITAVITVGAAAGGNAAPLQFDCDAADGHSSALRQAQAGPNYALGAEFSAKRLGKHRDWLPGARIAIWSADDRNSIIIQLAAGSVRPESLRLSLIATRDGNEKSLGVTTVKLDETVRASISVKDNLARVEVAGQPAEFPLNLGLGATVVVSCSTGQFMFETLDLNVAG